MNTAPNDLPDFCIPFPGNNDDLESVILRNWRLSKENVKELAGLSQIREIRIDSRSLDLESVQELANLPNIESIIFTSSAITDHHVELLAQLLSLKTLGLYGPNITDSCLKFIRHIELVSLGVPMTLVSDAGVAELSTGNIANTLRGLNLSGTNVTDDAIRHLARFSMLRELIVRSTKLTDSSIDLIPNKIVSLDLSETQISNNASESISRLTNLENLKLVRTSIGMETVRSCLSLPNLRVLDLCNTDVEDSIADQRFNGNLEEIWIIATKITAGGVNRIKTQNPGLKIQANPS